MSTGDAGTETDGRVVAVARYTARPGMEARLAEATRRLVETTLREDGPLTYEASQQADDARRFVAYEVWPDQATLDRHLAAPHFVRFVREELAALAEPVPGSPFGPIEAAVYRPLGTP